MTITTRKATVVFELLSAFNSQYKGFIRFGRKASLGSVDNTLMQTQGVELAHILWQFLPSGTMTAFANEYARLEAGGKPWDSQP